jgi:hypothetical protein
MRTNLSMRSSVFSTSLNGSIIRVSFSDHYSQSDRISFRAERLLLKAPELVIEFFTDCHADTIITKLLLKSFSLVELEDKLCVG